MNNLRPARLLVPLPLVLVLLSGCRGKPPEAPVIGEAWAGPAVLTLRRDIPLNSPPAATVKHGERLEIVQRRRRFIKVRTPSGAEGWCAENVLLGAQETAAFGALRERAAQMPSHGTASTFDLLNVHTTPSRRSPSFMQMKEGDKAEVLAHVVTPRAAPPRPPLIPPRPRKAAPARKRRQVKSPVLPLPKPPPPPPDWLEMSKTNLPEPEAPPEPPPPVPRDDWSLIRTSSGQAGWVLTSRLFMAIPDEVAQYAEGQRITSYFSLGEVQDGGQKRHHWLWTTISASLQDHDFDSFRVFIWNVRRRRYETAYIERRVKGWFPVRVRPVTLAATGREAAGSTFPGFSVCVEKEDGLRYGRDFAFIVNVVRPAGQGPCEVSRAWPPEPVRVAAAGAPADPQDRAASTPPASLFGRMKAAAASLASRLFGTRQSR